ncbi:uncharacterized protein AMSG_07883 [Thecamonas trahens ATCC 50062]|uniref:Uncharacterized protein n=1 Tax=Thecamonas trahens ATCC 50062 TaxID=461836 RepID=A0A0L0DHV0_THETB|nr:hypothetical protein AMSG_07883 [Thecamonas trahens ATCC 50062]KNC51805.1 hypothetical protein AMSG_07883 [Thecamonas trahens ATCC 50062]|eukprot:XP_013755672.1 hypothetical protein AMSG_07883 [Thecamonas trahens ATCC 50062]
METLRERIKIDSPESRGKKGGGDGKKGPRPRPALMASKLANSVKEFFKKGFAGSGMVKATVTGKAGPTADVALTSSIAARKPALKTDLKVKHTYKAAGNESSESDEERSGKPPRPSGLVSIGGLHYDGSAKPGQPARWWSGSSSLYHAGSGATFVLARDMKAGHESHGLRLEAKYRSELAKGVTVSVATTMALSSLPFAATKAPGAKGQLKAQATMTAHGADANGSITAKVESGRRASVFAEGLVGLVARRAADGTAMAHDHVSVDSHSLVLGVAGHADVWRAATGGEGATGGSGAPAVAASASWFPAKAEVSLGWLDKRAEHYTFVALANGEVVQGGFRTVATPMPRLKLFSQFVVEKPRQAGGGKARPASNKAGGGGKPQREAAQPATPSWLASQFPVLPMGLLQIGAELSVSRDAKLKARVDTDGKAAVAVWAKLSPAVTVAAVASGSLARPSHELAMGLGFIFKL